LFPELKLTFELASGIIKYERNKEKRFEQAQKQALSNIEKNTKIKPEQYFEIFKLLEQGKTQAEIAKKFKVSRSCIGLIKNKKRKEFQLK